MSCQSCWLYQAEVGENISTLKTVSIHVYNCYKKLNPYQITIIFLFSFVWCVHFLADETLGVQITFYKLTLTWQKGRNYPEIHQTLDHQISLS